jgi:hypothetical protein
VALPHRRQPRAQHEAGAPRATNDELQAATGMGSIARSTLIRPIKAVFCPRCAGRMELIGTIEDPALIARILAYLEGPAARDGPAPAPRCLLPETTRLRSPSPHSTGVVRPTTRAAVCRNPSGRHGASRLPGPSLLFDVSGTLWHDGPPMPEAYIALCQGRRRVELCPKMGFYVIYAPQRSLDRTRGRRLRGLLKIGLLPINTQLQAFYNAVGPENSSDWKLRFQVQFPHPRRGCAT